MVVADPRGSPGARPLIPVKRSQSKKDGCCVGPQVARDIGSPRTNFWTRYCPVLQNNRHRYLLATIKNCRSQCPHIWCTYIPGQICIFVQNVKFLCETLWLEELLISANDDDTNDDKARRTKHVCTGSLAFMPNESKILHPLHNAKLTEVRWSVMRYTFLRHLVGSMWIE